MLGSIHDLWLGGGGIEGDGGTKYWTENLGSIKIETRFPVNEVAVDLWSNTIAME